MEDAAVVHLKASWWEVSAAKGGVSCTCGSSSQSGCCVGAQACPGSGIVLVMGFSDSWYDSNSYHFFFLLWGWKIEMSNYIAANCGMLVKQARISLSLSLSLSRSLSLSLSLALFFFSLSLSLCFHSSRMCKKHKNSRFPWWILKNLGSMISGCNINPKCINVHVDKWQVNVENCQSIHVNFSTSRP